MRVSAAQRGWGVAAAVSLFGLAILALAPALPSLVEIPNVDYAIFQYAGERLNEGSTLYRDVFDHKPPLIFLLNALGLSLAGGSRWGIWALQLLSLSAAAALGFGALRKTLGGFPAWLAMAAFLANLVFVHEGGNLTEEYALPLYFWAISLVVAAGLRPRAAFQAFGCGLAIGLASSLKQPMAAPFIAVGVLLLAQRLSDRSKRGLVDLLWLGLGFASVWGVWFALFAAAGALREFWDAAFAFNVSIARLPLAGRLAALIEGGAFVLRASPFFSLAWAAWLAAVAYLLLHNERLLRLLTHRRVGWVVALVGLALLYNGLFRSGVQAYRLAELSPYRWVLIVAGLGLACAGGVYSLRRLDRPWFSRLAKWRQAGEPAVNLLLGFAVIDLPVEFALSALSGSNYRHYFMPMLPSMTVLVGFFTGWVLSSTRQAGKNRLGWVWAVSLSIPLVVSGALQTADQVYPTRDRAVSEAVAYVSQLTAPEERVLVWGGYPMVYTTSRRQAPSRFFYVKHLFDGSPAGEAYAAEFLRDLQLTPPALILQPRQGGQPFVYDVNASACAGLADAEEVAERLASEEGRDAAQAVENGGIFTRLKAGLKTSAVVPDGMPAVYRWICENYTEGTGLVDWVAYRYTPNRP